MTLAQIIMYLLSTAELSIDYATERIRFSLTSWDDDDDEGMITSNF